MIKPGFGFYVYFVYSICRSTDVCLVLVLVLLLQYLSDWLGRGLQNDQILCWVGN